MNSAAGLSSVYSVCSDAAGIIGNILAFALFVSPMPTFKRIIKKKSIDDFSGLPYIYGLLNGLICFWYGLPFISPGIILVATVNSIGAAFQLVYILIFIVYAHDQKDKRARMVAMLLGVLGAFGVVVLISLRITDDHVRQIFVGSLSTASLVSMFASPLFIIKLVITTKSVEYMPFYLSLTTFLMSLLFFIYGFFKHDAFIYVPNGIGVLLGAAQLALYSYYNSLARSIVSRDPLLESLV